MSNITLDNVLLGALVTLATYAVWTIQRYIAKDDVFKQSMAEKFEEGRAQRLTCAQNYALRTDVNNIFSILRKHGEQLAAIQACVKQSNDT